MPRAAREHVKTTSPPHGERSRLDGERARLAARAVETRGVLDECDSLIARFERDALQQRELATAEGARGDAAAVRVAELQERYRGVASDLAASESRLHTIEELEATLEGHVPGTRAVVEAAARGEINGLLGVVSNLIEVDERYARALDVAFGAGLSNIVTATSEDANANASARARSRPRDLLPLDTLAARDGRKLGAPRAGRASSLRARSRAQRSASAASFRSKRRVLVVDELRTGIALVRGENFRDSIAWRANRSSRRRDHRRPLPPRTLDLGRRAQARRCANVSYSQAELETIERDGLAKADVDAAGVARDAAVTAAGEAEAALRDASARRNAAEAEIARIMASWR